MVRVEPQSHLLEGGCRAVPGSDKCPLTSALARSSFPQWTCGYLFLSTFPQLAWVEAAWVLIRALHVLMVLTLDHPTIYR